MGKAQPPQEQPLPVHNKSSRRQSIIGLSDFFGACSVIVKSDVTLRAKAGRRELSALWILNPH